MTLALADTSIWVGHFRRPNPALQVLLAADRVLCHPLVILELACGTPPSPRERTLGDLQMLRPAVMATSEEIVALVRNSRLHDSGCGAVDMALLASVLLTPDTRLWTVDRKLEVLATRLGVGFNPADAVGNA